MQKSWLIAQSCSLTFQYICLLCWSHLCVCGFDRDLCRYDRRSGGVASTSLGRVASYYYLSHQSMAVYNEYLKPTMSDIELFRLFSLRLVMLCNVITSLINSVVLLV
jgi:Sec63 Brl domain